MKWRVVKVKARGAHSLDLTFRHGTRKRVNLPLLEGPVLLDVTSEEWDRVFAVNAKGTFFTVQAALRRMLPRKHGRIVTIGSDSYKLGGGRIANIPYAATKGAVVTMTKGFARALVGTGIRINCVNPGPCDTPMHAPLTAEQRAMVAGRVPLGRFGLPDEIASAVLFLLSDAASFVFGESFNVDGAAVDVSLDVEIEARARELSVLGFAPLDALHIACAERAEARWFVTCDDRLLRLAERLGGALRTPVVTPGALIGGAL